MKMFINRLALICFYIVAFVIVFAAVLLANWVLDLIYPDLFSILVGGFSLLVIAFLICAGIYEFIKWLFVEPFRKGKAK